MDLEVVWPAAANCSRHDWAGDGDEVRRGSRAEGEAKRRECKDKTLADRTKSFLLNAQGKSDDKWNCQPGATTQTSKKAQLTTREQSSGLENGRSIVNGQWRSKDWAWGAEVGGLQGSVVCSDYLTRITELQNWRGSDPHASSHPRPPQTKQSS